MLKCRLFTLWEKKVSFCVTKQPPEVQIKNTLATFTMFSFSKSKNSKKPPSISPEHINLASGKKKPTIRFSMCDLHARIVDYQYVSAEKHPSELDWSFVTWKMFFKQRIKETHCWADFLWVMGNILDWCSTSIPHWNNEMQRSKKKPWYRIQIHVNFWQLTFEYWNLKLLVFYQMNSLKGFSIKITINIKEKKIDYKLLIGFSLDTICITVWSQTMLYPQLSS